MANIEIKDLLEAGVHFGHLTRKWDPNMAPYIYGERNGVHIIDLYKTAAKMEEAAEALKLTAEDMKKQKLIDGIIKEPLGGAHYDRETAFKEVEKTILKAYKELKVLSTKELVKQRMAKYCNMGEFKD